MIAPVSSPVGAWTVVVDVCSTPEGVEETILYRMLRSGVRVTEASVIEMCEVGGD